jgi:hypothetical protein
LLEEVKAEPAGARKQEQIARDLARLPGRA